MTELGRESLNLIAAARNRDRMGANDKARIRRKIAQRVGSGLAAGTALATSATLAQATHTSLVTTAIAWLPTVAKVVGVLTVSGAIGTLGVNAVQSMRHDTADAKTAPTALRAAAPLPHTESWQKVSANTLAPPYPSTPSLATKPPPTITREPTRLVARTTSESHAGRPSAKAVETETETAQANMNDALGHQVAAIRESRAALRRGDAQSALAALDRVATGEQGPLEQEAMLARVSALCLKGDVATARRIADNFIARFSDSLLVAKLRATCAFDSTPSQ